MTLQWILWSEGFGFGRARGLGGQTWWVGRCVRPLGRREEGGSYSELQRSRRVPGFLEGRRDSWQVHLVWEKVHGIMDPSEGVKVEPKRILCESWPVRLPFDH